MRSLIVELPERIPRFSFSHKSFVVELKKIIYPLTTLSISGVIQNGSRRKNGNLTTFHSLGNLYTRNLLKYGTIFCRQKIELRLLMVSWFNPLKSRFSRNMYRMCRKLFILWVCNYWRKYKSQ